MSKISIYDFPALKRAFQEHKLDPHQLTLLQRAFFKKHRRDQALIEALPEGAAEVVANQVQTRFLELAVRQDSQIDGASKLLFRTHDGKEIETVILRIATGRITLCISSQVGCKFRCAFCATGAMGFIRNLTTDEILDQVAMAIEQLGDEADRLKNIVFMGMGEPLDNYENLCGSIDVLAGSGGFNIAYRNIMVSSTGLGLQMEELAERYPDLSIALSLHYANDRDRQAYMPINSRFTLADLKQTMLRLKATSNRPVMVEYLMFDQLNDQLEHADQLAEFLKDTNCMVNLITYNAHDHADKFQGSPREQVLAFQERLLSYDLKVTRRYSLGADISAACGQLVTEKKHAK